MSYSPRAARVESWQNRRFRPSLEALEDRLMPSLTVGPVVDIGPVAGNQSEASLAINPTNPNNIVAFSNDLSVASGIRVYVSNDGGSTWTNRLIANGDGLGVAACCDTQAAFDQYGNLFAVYLDQTGGNYPVRVLLSTDGGGHFSLVATVAKNGDQPSIATGAGSVWVTYNSSNKIWAAGARVTGLGHVGSFSSPEVASGSNGGNFGNIAISPTGAVLVTYQSPSNNQGPATIYLNVDADGFGAGGFGSARFITTTNVGGFDYLPAQPDRSIDAEANLYFDRSGGAHNGRVYLVYTDEFPNESNDTNIYVRYSDNNGTTWSAPVRVNDDTGASSQFFPMAAIDQNTGNLAVAWYDARNAGSANNTTQIYTAISTDGGRTFSANVQVAAGVSNSHLADPSDNFGDFYTMEFVNGVFRPVWADNSNSTGTNPDGALHALDICTAKVTYSSATGGQRNLPQFDPLYLEAPSNSGQYVESHQNNRVVPIAWETPINSFPAWWSTNW